MICVDLADVEEGPYLQLDADITSATVNLNKMDFFEYPDDLVMIEEMDGNDRLLSDVLAAHVSKEESDKEEKGQ